MRISTTVRNIIIIIAILVMAFLSQQSYLKSLGPKTVEQGNTYWQKTLNWIGLGGDTPEKIGDDLQKKGEEVKQGAVDVKNNFLISMWENIKKYFAEKFSNLFGTKVE